MESDCDQSLSDFIDKIETFIYKPETRSKDDILDQLNRERAIIRGRSVGRRLVALMGDRQWVVCRQGSEVKVTDLDGEDLHDVSDTLYRQMDIESHFSTFPYIIYLDMEKVEADALVDFIHGYRDRLQQNDQL